MLSFVTEFPVNETTTAPAFLDAVRTWILGSPHTTLLPADLAALGGVDEWRLPPGPESVVALCPRSEGEDAVAVQYIRVNDGLEWTTTIVFRKLEAGPWTSIRISCESTYPQAHVPSAKKPVVIRVLMQQLGAGKDGALSVQHTPHALGDEDIELAVRLMNGTSACRLPVIYVSVGFDGMHTVDAGVIARELAGMAHVVVEPNRAFSQRLRNAVQRNNVYGGTVGIYWPDGAGRRAFYIGSDLRSPEDVVDAVCREVRTALLNRRPLEECTWSAVQGLVSRQRMLRLQESGSQEVQSYIDTFERELQAAREQRERTEAEVERLRAEIRRLETRGETPFELAEQDFYPGEIVDIIRDALEDARTRVPQKSRRLHVIDAFLDAYSRTGTAAEHRETLKSVLRGYTSLDRKIRRALEDLGFDIFEDGRHHKLVYQGDERYTYSLPKTGSDHRGGLNSVTEIGNGLF